MRGTVSRQIKDTTDLMAKFVRNFPGDMLYCGGTESFRFLTDEILVTKFQWETH